MPQTLTTDRLLLRRWTAEDREPFAALNADPDVMEHFFEPLTREQSDALADRADAHLAEHGWGLWALEVRTGPDAGRFAGFTGLAVPGWDAPFNPCIEVGWRLARWAWGSGYASEAARAALAVAFDELGHDEVVSFTAVSNERSQAVMRRIGMTRDAADDFVHPGRPAGHRLAPHVLFRLPVERWRTGTDARHG